MWLSPHLGGAFVHNIHTNQLVTHWQEWKNELVVVVRCGRYNDYSVHEQVTPQEKYITPFHLKSTVY